MAVRPALWFLVSAACVLSPACGDGESDSASGFGDGGVSVTGPVTATATASGGTSGGDGGDGADGGASDDGGTSGSGGSGPTSGADSGDGGTGGGPTPCGNGTIEGDEECDTADFAGKTCADYEQSSGNAFDGGTLGCGVDCKVVTTGCTRCGDGVVAGDETCDSSEVGGATCTAMGFGGGAITCNATCDGLDDTGCFTCGNDKVEGAEDCDGGPVTATCSDLGYTGDGEIGCNADCTYDARLCCGDGQRAPTEACDCGDLPMCTTGLLGFKTCGHFDAPNGIPFTGGQLGCTAACEHETSMCTYCGDGALNGGEDCEAGDLGGKTCVSLNYIGGGTLACANDCNFDTGSCVGPQCGTSLDPAGGACPGTCTGGCPDANTCVIDCQGTGRCQDIGAIDCPNGFNCHVRCIGEEACEGNTVINCPSDGDCLLECGGGDSACDATDLNCSTTGLCHTTCDYQSGGQVCWAMSINCGNNQCRVDCTPQSVSFGPSLTCNDSCDCAENCQ